MSVLLAGNTMNRRNEIYCFLKFPYINFEYLHLYLKEKPNIFHINIRLNIVCKRHSHFHTMMFKNITTTIKLSQNIHIQKISFQTSVCSAVNRVSSFYRSLLDKKIHYSDQRLYRYVCSVGRGIQWI